LIDLKLIGSGTLGTPDQNPLLRLSASGTYNNGDTRDQEWFRVDNNGNFVAFANYDAGLTGSIPAESSGVRFLWYGGKAAIRAGGIDGTQWDDANVGLYSTAFGENVRALGDNAVAIGKSCVAAGSRTTAIGEGCTATGYASVALGYGASTSTSAGSPRVGTFVFSDFSVPLVYNFGSNIDSSSQFHPTVTNSFNVRAVNGSFFYTNTALTTGLTFNSTTANLTLTNSKLAMASDGSTTLYSNSSLTSGVTLPAGGGTWNSVSDRNMKENFAPVDGEDVLARLRNVPISIWNYKSQNANVRHIGPMAQDFAAAFHVGDDDKHISTIDPDGVALAGVKALDDRTSAQESRIEVLEKENAELRKRLDRLEKLLSEERPAQQNRQD
ncbi:MAG TPA: tail fiber domain-containing protein, partial [Thermoanaerobaculia bacterium]